MLKQLQGDMFELKNPDMSSIAFCVTTNSITKTNGDAVMGAGVALQVAEMFPDIPAKLGEYINIYGNRAFNLGTYEFLHTKARLFSFPTKYCWWNKSSLSLIESSCYQLLDLCDKFGIDTCYLPAPGIGKGGLAFKDIEPVINDILDNRFTICFK